LIKLLLVGDVPVPPPPTGKVTQALIPLAVAVKLAPGENGSTLRSVLTGTCFGDSSASIIR
jgi:hypothetical protein